MAQNYEIDIKRFNGQDYDTLLPTPASHASTHQADGSDPITVKTGNIEDGAVINAKIANGAVSTEKIASGAVQTSKISDGAITRAKLAVDAKVLSFTNKTVATSAWASDATYQDFPYRAAVACEGVTAKHYAEVSFSPSDAMSGSFAPVAASYDGGVYIYASEIPEAALTIPTTVCTPVE